MNSSEWDVIVVGARVAGNATAIRFADSGRRVLVVDRAREGSDTLSTHGFGGPEPMPQLQALGVLDQALQTGAPKLTHFSLDCDQGTMHLPIQNEFGYTLSIRRTALDPILADRARAAGAEVRYGTAMRDLVWEGDRVAGVVVETPDGRTEEHRARLVVGADGRHSPLADLVGAQTYDEVTSISSAIYSYMAGVAPLSVDALHFASGPNADSIIQPSDGDVTCVLLIIPNDEFDGVKDNTAEAYEKRIRTIPAAASRLANARRIGRVRPVQRKEVDGKFRTAAGPGWALVGDAGCKQHPAAGQGIGDAMRCAELLHEHVEGAWHQGAEPDPTTFQAARDAEFKARYDLSFSMAALNPFNNGGLARIMLEIRNANAPVARATSAP